MIYVFQGGRCGNQMFSYAFSMKLKKSFKNEEICYIYNFDSDLKGNYWEDSLEQFVLDGNYKSNNEKNVFRNNSSFIQKMIMIKWKILKRRLKNKSYNYRRKKYEIFFERYSKYGIYYLPYGYSKYNVTKQKNKFVFGTFEDVRWFNDLKEELKKYFEPKTYNRNNDLLFNKIQSTNSVCISFRKWNIDVTRTSEIDNREICTDKYYKQAIEYIFKVVDKPVFFIFSDDVSWATNFIKENFPNIDFYSESGIDTVSEKIRLMKECKHFILTNSTFCWWAQYLCKNKEKIVVSPKIWHKKNKSDQLNMPSFKLISIGDDDE